MTRIELMNVVGRPISVDFDGLSIGIQTPGGTVTASREAVYVCRSPGGRSYWLRVAVNGGMRFVEWRKPIRKSEAEALASALGVGITVIEH